MPQTGSTAVSATDAGGVTLRASALREIVLRELRRSNTGFWTEQRWIEDCERFVLLGHS